MEVRAVIFIAAAACYGVILGAPNVVRGGGHIGCLDAAPAIGDGLCTVLASDYFYPAMLAAIAQLDAEKRADRDGRPTFTGKIAYGQCVAMYAFGEYYRATGDTRGREAMLRTDRAHAHAFETLGQQSPRAD